MAYIPPLFFDGRERPRIGVEIGNLFLFSPSDALVHFLCKLGWILGTGFFALGFFLAV
jgi:hypothetical protein